LDKEEDGRTRVKLNTQKKGQLFAWGAGGRIAKKFWSAVDEQLKKKKKTRDPS
jgi:hypothetical protein